jgi:hypothetical protein
VSRPGHELTGAFPLTLRAAWYRRLDRVVNCPPPGPPRLVEPPRPELGSISMALMMLSLGTRLAVVIGGARGSESGVSAGGVSTESSEMLLREVVFLPVEPLVRVVFESRERSCVSDAPMLSCERPGKIFLLLDPARWMRLEKDFLGRREEGSLFSSSSSTGVGVMLSRGCLTWMFGEKKKNRKL